MNNIICLMACHNRSEKTYRCITALCNVFDYLNFHFEIVVVLDNCIDDTKEKLSSINGNIDIIEYSGRDLYWAGGMLYGFENAVVGKSYEYLICVNDDIELDLEQTNKELHRFFFNQVNKRSSAFVGSFKNQFDATSYGALVNVSKFHPLKLRRLDPNEDQTIHTFNMNFVVLPKEIIRKVGFLSKHYRHSKADLDLGYRINEANFKITQSTDYLGVCERNSRIANFCYAKTNLKKALQCLNHPLREPIKERWVFLCDHGTLSLRVVHLLMPYITFIARFWSNKMMSLFR